LISADTEIVGFCFTNAKRKVKLPLLMSRSLVLIIYNILLPVFFVFAFPAWLVKMWKRGGYGTGLLERFACFKTPRDQEAQGVIYVHAVSVGEVLIALKLIESWLRKYPTEKMVLAATTSTGHEVARQKAPSSVRVIYSPLDFGFLVRAVMNRFTPRQIVLIESEMWPNFLNMARQRDIPVSMVNARLSQRSERRFLKFASLVQPLFEMVSCYCVQNEGDAQRFENLGVPKEKILITGSMKFDPSDGTAPQKCDKFQQMLDSFGVGRRVVMAASTHAGEEQLIGVAHRESGVDALYVVVPRHAERRSEVVAALESTGYEVILRSDFHPPKSSEKACLVVDSTGELRDWTAHADVMIIGKSWLGEGGQNPAEAIMARVPVVCGPSMSNFEPLITMLRDAGGVKMLKSADTLAQTISELLSDSMAAQTMAAQAQAVLSSHAHAVEKTIGNLKK
jgi:3-deoxy-D-manno-octulosonic-acid transferase